MIQDYFVFATRSLRKRKLRSGLTMIGVIISIATIFTLISLSFGLQNAISEQFRSIGADKLFIQPKGQLGAPGTGGAVQLTLDDVNAVKRVAGVKEVIYMVAGNAKIDFAGKTRYYIVAGLPLEDEKAFQVLSEAASWKIDEGNMLKRGDSGEIVIGSRYKNGNLFGREIKLGNSLTINGKKFRVKGILKSVGNPSDDQNIFMSFDDYKDLFNNSKKVDVIYVQVMPGQDINIIAEKIKKALKSERGVTDKTIDFTILTPTELLASFKIILNIITAFLAGVAAISLVVGGIGIANTMYTSVLERTKEIGTMKAIGARNSDILLIFIIESGLLGLVGGIMGVLLGMGLSKIIEFIVIQILNTNLLKIEFGAWLIFGSLAFSFLIGVFSGFLPSRQASKLNPVDALRYE